MVPLGGTIVILMEISNMTQIVAALAAAKAAGLPLRLTHVTPRRTAASVNRKILSDG